MFSHNRQVSIMSVERITKNNLVCLVRIRVISDYCTSSLCLLHFICSCFVLSRFLIIDEENMRHWSHHYSTDTVDDPVFRAAMRGCDAVSFVFGLEVTWSLIQQRQQEEEEAQAAKVLEEMQENGELNGLTTCEDAKPAAVESDNDEECDDESTSPPEAATGSTEQESTKTASYELENSEDSSDDSEEGEEGEELPTTTTRSVASDLEVSDKESNEPQSSRTVRQEAKNGTTTSAKKTTIVLDLSSDDDEQESESRTEKQAGDKKTTQSGMTDSLATIAASDDPPTPPNKWNCGACTFLNKMAARKCEICNAFRPKPRSSVMI